MLVMGSTYVTYALGLLASIIVARALGPDDFGRYSYVVWLVGLLIMVGNNGLNATALRFISESLGRQSPETARAVHGWARRRQYACLVLIAVAFAALVPFVMPAGWEDRARVFVALTLAAAVPKALFMFDASVGKGYGRYGVEATSSVVMSVINMIAVLLLMQTGAGLIAYMALFAATSAGYALSSRLLLRAGDLGPTRAPLPPELLGRLRPHLFWTVILTTAYAFNNKSIETWLLNDLVGAAAVGYFAIAGALTRGGIEMLSAGLSTVLMPMMAHAFGEGRDQRAGRIMASAMRYYSFIGLLIGGVGVLVAAPAVSLLYGDAYTGVILPFQIMIGVTGLTLAESALHALLSTTDNQRIRVVFVLVSLGITAALAFALVPRYGLMGAVAAHTGSRLIVFIAIAGGISRMMDMRLPLRELGRLLAAAVVAAGVAAVPMAVVSEQWIGWVAGIVYAVVFAACSLAFGAWRGPDASLLLGFLAQYPRIHDRVAAPIRRWADRLPDEH
nr:polysaccharide biosynthesis C-terminal domain-containing protein [Lysobacter antarcticus]